LNLGFVKDSLECVAGSIRDGFKDTQNDLEEGIEEEWIPNPLIAEHLNRMYAKEPLQSSDVLQKFPC
jgi:hypothetical protein